jgi:formylglycine-generating enzyme required for sulfatase activity
MAKIAVSTHQPGDSQHPDLIWIPGGTFLMGSEDFYPEERPVHEVKIDGFWMDRYTVTNEQFARFVDATGKD